MEILKRYIHKDSIIFSDGWRGYLSVGNYFKDHKVVNHRYDFVDPSSGAHTNTIEGNWAPLKRSILAKVRRYDKIKLYLLRAMMIRNDPLNVLLQIINHLF